ncbi:hypothetical protein CDAR_194841 [Caerostris darwini]|uniref:Uncharacterized protein n=1 Tax=Caerostris darwini TaxID=1538125 RepID=A0AAV4X8E5_9ARAC|nr:hypothetical protein CDAR_194841 [Caerostris darwini]
MANTSEWAVFRNGWVGESLRCSVFCEILYWNHLLKVIRQPRVATPLFLRGVGQQPLHTGGLPCSLQPFLIQFSPRGWEFSHSLGSSIIPQFCRSLPDEVFLSAILRPNSKTDSYGALKY